jgi:uncharacterized protein YqhQ
MITHDCGLSIIQKNLGLFVKGIIAIEGKVFIKRVDQYHCAAYLYIICFVSGAGPFLDIVFVGVADVW